MASEVHLSSDSESEEEQKLSKAQLARIERNRQKALLLRQSKVQSRPFVEGKPDKHKMKPLPTQIDTGAGFFIEDDQEQNKKQKISHPEGPMLSVDDLICENCEKKFMKSFLLAKFDVVVCDICRQDEEKYAMISKTDAKKQFLLKDCDFDKREPVLKCIIRKNPYNPQWGEMKLYLENQVRQRAMEIWGDEEKLEEQHDKLEGNREKQKKKKFDKRVKELRLAVRSSLWRKETGSHDHDFEEETYNEDEDNYSKTCKTCGHVLNFEKM